MIKKRKITSETLADEVVDNIRSDRDRIVKLLDQLVSVSTTPTGEEVVGREPTTLNVFADVAARLTDVLTKQSAMLVELAKIESKRKPEEDPERVKDDIFREISHGSGKEPA